MFFRRFRPLLLACTSLAACQAPGLVFAQSASPAAETPQATAAGQLVLPTLTVRASRSPKGAVSDTPLATQTTADEIAKREITDLDDLGNTTEPGVSFVEATKSVNIRGLEGDRVLTTIDGIPIPYLSDAVRGSYGGADTYDFSSLSTVDILRGSDSSRAGSGALGGAVILRTLEPENLIQPGRDFGGIARTVYDSSDNSIMGTVGIAKKIDDTSMLFQGTYKRGHETSTSGDVGGYGSTRTEADPMDFNNANLLFKLRRSLAGGHTIGMTAEHYNSTSTTDLAQTQGTTYKPGNYDELSDKKRDRISADYRYEAPDDDGLIDSASATLYWQRTIRGEGTDGYRLTAPIGTYSRFSTNEERAIGFSGFANSSFATGLLQHQLTYGADLALATTSQYQTGADSCSVTYVASCAYLHNNQADMPETDSRRIGLFIEDRITLSDSAVSLTPGLRFDWYDYEPNATSGYSQNSGYAGLPAGQSDMRISPKLRAAWQVTPDIELFAQFATGFKAPSVTQLYMNYDNAPLYRQIGNPDLKAETSYGFEGGANLGDESFGGRITGFTTRYDNFIDTQTTTVAGYRLGSYEYFNRSKVRISGIELSAHKTFDMGFNLHGALSYARGTDLDTDQVIASVPPLKLILGGGYAAETWGSDLTFVGTTAVDKDSTASFKAPGYGVFNLTGWWEPEQAKGLRIQAGIYNLFDREYYDALETKDVAVSSASARSFYSEPGRTFKISLTQKF
ncbi:MAG: TonB-dependent hemoglobin/transferrin/lactoferrin family receptor [Allorhizobium sp.]